MLLGGSVLVDSSNAVWLQKYSKQPLNTFMVETRNLIVYNIYSFLLKNTLSEFSIHLTEYTSPRYVWYFLL